MKQEISALMDGELFEDEADVLLEQCKYDPVFDRNWAVYHLIGDVLRQPEYIHSDVCAGLRERLQDEPAILVPRARAVKEKMRAYALSAAASVAAVGLVAWMSVQIAPEGMGSAQMAQRPANTRMVSVEVPQKANDYLMAHQEMSPGMDMNGGASYIRTAAYSLDEK